MIFIDSYDWENRLGPDVARPFLYEGTVAHELQHLIHNDHDGNEDSWVDEGMADLAQYFCGYGHDDGHVVYYLAYHRTPLTVWGGGLESYGASYLFQLYLLENFSTETGGVWDPTLDAGAGGSSRRTASRASSSQTGAIFNDLYDAWIVANYLDDPAQDGAGGLPDRLRHDQPDAVRGAGLEPVVDRAQHHGHLRRGPQGQCPAAALLGRVQVGHG